MAVAIYWHGEHQVRKTMAVPKRASDLQKWFKAAVKALGDNLPPTDCISSATATVIEIDRIVWLLGNGGQIIIDRTTSSLC